jgi:malate synthase
MAATPGSFAPAPSVKPLKAAFAERVLTPEALAFLGELHDRFAARRDALLEARKARAARIASGESLDFPTETAAQRAADWRVPPAPKDLADRRVEITGPAEAKMMINALNSGARVFMCDLEDALSPTWDNAIGGQIALQDAVRRTLSFTSPEGKAYKLKDNLATLVVRPRGWHLPEKHLEHDGRPASGSLVDFGLYVFHNGKEAAKRGTGAYLYLPKLEGRAEAALWSDVIGFAEERLGLVKGSIRCTVLIETILAAFEMDEILFALKDRIVGLNAGRWDYLFSMIKTFAHDSSRILPDRALVTMGVGFMRAYTDLLVKTCHRRGAHAIGGMAAFVPSRKDAEVNKTAFAKVTEDKEREARQGFDGTWVAHPDLVPVAQAVFDRVLAHPSPKPNQLDVARADVEASAKALLDVAIPGGRVTTAGVRLNVDVGVQYIAHWLKGLGAVALHNLMEDAATAEISRAQLWQWLKHEVRLEDGQPLTRARYQALRDEALAALPGRAEDPTRFADAAALLDELVLAPTCRDFLTLPAYQRL